MFDVERGKKGWVGFLDLGRRTGCPERKTSWAFIAVPAHDIGHTQPAQVYR